MFPTEHHWRMSQSALTETRVPFLPLLVECLTYGRMRQYFFPRSVVSQLVSTRAVSELVSDKDKQTITSRGP